VKRRFRLARSTDFQRVRRIGKSYAHPLVVLLLAPNDLDHVRVGFVAGKAIGNAVQRNRVKRRLRACLSSWLPCFQGGWDMVFLARKPMDQAGFIEICAAVQALLKRVGIPDDRSS
jgi:ribonuclease P protein component